MEALSYCQLMERCLAAEARVVELTAENVTIREQSEEVYSAGYNHGHLNTVDGIAYADCVEDEFYSLALQVMAEVETPTTDRIYAGIKADGVALAKSAFEKHIQSPSCYRDEVIGMESALSIASQVELQLRESAK